MISKCGSCGGARFELKENSPSKSNFKINFVQCVSCGVPVGVIDYYDVHSKLNEIAQKIEDIEQKLN